MRFLTNPDKFVFCIGIGVVGFLFILSYMILNQMIFLSLVLILWMIFSVYLAQINHIEYEIHNDGFIVKHMRKTTKIKYKDIDCIFEYSSYTNSIRIKKYIIKLMDGCNVPDKFLKIENKAFSEWIDKEKSRFNIKRISEL